MTATIRKPSVPGRTTQLLLWLLVFLGSFVALEPAPYDLLAVGLIPALFLSGLRIPPGLGFPISAMAVFVLMNVISIAIGHDVERSFFFFGVTAYLILSWLMFAALVYADADRVLYTIWHAYVATATIATTLGILGYLGINPPDPFGFAGPWGRIRGAFKDPNVFAPFLVPVVAYLIADLRGGTKKISVGRALLALYIIIGILLAYSRAAWANCILTVLVLGFLRLITSEEPNEMLRKSLAGTLIGGVITIALVLLITYTKVGDLFAERAHFFQSYDLQNGGRFSNMMLGLQSALDNPFGVGPGHSELDLNQWTGGTHDTYIRIVVENGWIALLAFIAFLAVSIWKLCRLSLRNTPHQVMVHIVLASLIGTIGNGLVIDTLHWRHMFLMLGLAWGLICLYPIMQRRVPLMTQHRAPRGPQNAHY